MRATDFVESYFSAWNHCDAQGVADHLADGGVYRDIPENVQRSHDELITSLTDFFSDHQHHYELIGEILSGDNSIGFQYRMCPSEGSSEKLQSKSYFGAEFVTLNGDEAITIIDYYDIPGMSRPSNLARLTSRETQLHKYAKSGLTEKQFYFYKRRLEQIMETQHLFLKPDLTLPLLAEIIDCSANHLSQVINAGFGLSFFGYLNQHRISHAQRLLSEPGAENKSILNMALALGFNSNSAFYAAFKKHVGKTPSQFRQAQNNRTH